MFVVGLLGFRLRQWGQRISVAVQMFPEHLFWGLPDLACVFTSRLHCVWTLEKKWQRMVRRVVGNHERMEIEHWVVR
jgi:hypothetical protein